MIPSINIIGCGRAASSLAGLWREAGVVRVSCIMNRSAASSALAASRIGAGRPVSRLDSMEPADFWLIGTTDDQIENVARALSTGKEQVHDALVFHLAGRFGLDVLKLLRRDSVHLAALHPVRSLAGSPVSREDFAGTACVAEGEEEALARLMPLVTAIGGTWLPVAAIDRGLYHASVSIISNITKAVAWKAQKWQRKAGLSDETAQAVTHQLLHSTMEDLFRAGARQSITGPVVRGDTSTIEAHIEALMKSHPEDVEVYRVLAHTVLDLARDRGDLDEATFSRFETLLRT